MIPQFLLQWKNISVTVTQTQYSMFRTTKKEKTILDNVSGSATSKSLVAVMGPSGSGKTTFLNAISGKIKDMEGTMKINNTIVTNEDMFNISGYMQQQDVFTETLTVYEHMIFMAALKLSKTEEETNSKIKKLLMELCLDECKYTLIQVLSGGQRRRLSLATELINDPYILFCDEPTTGLDSSSAMMVVKILEATTMSGKMILVTLHQPSSQIFDLFNDIILLANGKLIFEGSKQQAKLFFESANLYCPVSYNPADFYMKHITASYENDSELRKITRLCKLFNDNFQRPNEGTNFYHSNGLFKQRINKKNVMVQLKWLIWRAFIDSKRSLYIYKTNYICLMIGALIIATLFSNVKLDSSSSVQSIQGALFLIVSELVFTHMYCVIPIFPEEVVVFVREKSLYSSFPYFFSKVLSLIPVCFVNGISFLIVYFTVLQFLQSIPLFLNMCVILIFTCLCGIALGLCLSALFPSVEYIHLFIVPLETAAMLVSGIWIKIDTLPRVISFLKYFSPFYYGFQGISIVAWEKVDFIANCTMKNVLPCYVNGKVVLEQYGFKEDYDIVGYSCLCLCLQIMVYCSIGYLGIIRKRNTHNV